MMRTARKIACNRWKEISLALPEDDLPALEKFEDARAELAAIHSNRHIYKLSKRSQPLKYLIDACRGVLQLYRWLKKNPAAIVHANDLLDFHAALAGWLAGSKVIWHLRTVRPKWMVAPFLFLMRALATRVISVSRATAHRMLGKSFQKVTVVYDSPPDAHVFDPRKYPAEVTYRTRESLGLVRSDFVIGMVGKLVRLKGHEYFLRACRHVLNKIPSCKLVIVGGSVAGHEAYERELQNLARELDLQNRLIFAGFRDDVPGLIAAFDVMLQVSIFEDPFPGVVLQGMAMEKPVIASRLGGIPEQIEDGVTGLLVDPHASEAVASRIVSLYEDVAFGERLGKAARAAVYAKFQDDAVAINAIYDEILKVE